MERPWTEAMASPQNVSQLSDFIFSVLSCLVAALSTAQKQHSIKSLMSFLLSNPWSGFQSSSLLSSRKSCALLSLKLSFRGFQDLPQPPLSLNFPSHALSLSFASGPYSPWPLNFGILALISSQSLVSLQANLPISMVLLWFYYQCANQSKMLVCCLDLCSEPQTSVCSVDSLHVSWTVSKVLQPQHVKKLMYDFIPSPHKLASSSMFPCL